MPHTEGENAVDNLVLHTEGGGPGKWVPGPNAQFKLIADVIGGGKGFSRAAIHRKLIAHHEETHGQNNTSFEQDAEWGAAGRGHSQTTFHKQLPGEVKRYLEGNPAARHVFRVTQDSDKAGGADAMSDLGEDKYFSHVDRLHGSTLNAALDTARNSPDPEMKFAAMIHDNLPDATARKQLGSVDAAQLKVGQQFTYGGEPFRVVEDADGYKVLHGMGEDFPLDALKQIPVDRGSLKKAKAPKAAKDDIAPFSAADAATDALWLHNPTSELKDAVVLGMGLPMEHLGQPVKYLWSDAISCGSYVHPVTGQNFSIDRTYLDGLVTGFGQMKANGTRPPVVDDHKELAATNNGWVVDAKRDGDRLMLLHQFIGEDAIRKASRNYVSLKLCKEYRDAKRNVYRNVFSHSALTPCPVIPNQQGFVAASRGTAANDSDAAGNVPDVFILAAPQTQGSKAMAFTPEQLQRIRKLTGAASVTDDGAADFLLSFAESANENLPTLLSRATEAEEALELARNVTPDDAQLSLSRVTSERDTLATERDTLATQVQELSRKMVKPLDPEAEMALKDAVDVKLSNAVLRGGINPATQKALRLLLVEDAKGNTNTLALSRAANPTGKTAFALALADVLVDNRPVPLGSQTDIQILSRVSPGDEVSEDEKAKKAAADMLNKHLGAAKA